MSNANKAKGTDWERAVRHFLNESLGKYVDGWRDLPYPWRDPRDPENVTRPAQTGAKDVGDLHAWPVVLECKAERGIRLADYVRQANKEAMHAGYPFGAAVVKAPRRSVQDGYVVMDLGTFSRMLLTLRYADCDTP
ncbi:hypothetical protein [Streptomyces sp. MNP-20]|uniref:hypothetical protein n=1 Tax=Streptomyces sp. MNP-20 TaxID=2721165 RepID=UPI001556D563|nr:hypothetical protein [Streptomyces sp. MNP-20]